jgi:hypothetical protein
MDHRILDNSDQFTPMEVLTELCASGWADVPQVLIPENWREIPPHLIPRPALGYWHGAAPEPNHRVITSADERRAFREYRMRQAQA